MPVEVLEEVKNHLEVLSSNFEGYFSDIDNFGTEYSIWIQNPFSFDVSVLRDSDETVMDDLIQWFLTFFSPAPLFRDLYRLAPTLM